MVSFCNEGLLSVSCLGEFVWIDSCRQQARQLQRQSSIRELQAPILGLTFVSQLSMLFSLFGKKYLFHNPQYLFIQNFRCGLTNSKSRNVLKYY